MPVPLPVAIPAAAAGLAYLNARAAIWYDCSMLQAVLPSVIAMQYHIYRGRANLFYRIEDAAKAAATAQHPFILFENHSYTYSQVYNLSLRYGVWWKETMGVRRGDIVALNFMNSDVMMFLWLGLWAIGAKPALINYNLRDQPLVHCVQTAKTALLIVDPEVAGAITPEVRAGLPDTRIEVFSPPTRAEAEAMPPTRYPDSERYEDKGENLAILIYTSGTTGLPKAAVVSWAKIITSGSFTCRWLGLSRKDVYYTCMPLYHSSASLLCFSTVIHGGLTMAIGRRFSNKTFWPEVRQHKATAIQYVGETCRYLLSAPPQIDPETQDNLDRKHSVRIAFGNGLRPDIWERFKDRFGIDTIIEFYGATEGSMATFNKSRNSFSTGAVGRNGWVYSMLLGRNVALVPIDLATEKPIRDPATGYCKRAGYDEPGELVFRLPAEDVAKRFQGYFGNNKATEAKIMRDVFGRGDAWFRTGDVVRRSRDGLLYFNDRIGDTFRWKSENVSTTEVANAVGLHPGVLEVNVYGVELPNHDGRAGCAALVAKKPVTPEMLQSLMEHVRAALPRFAQPLFLRVIEDFGAYTTGTNKQQKHVLRDEGVHPDKVGKDQIYWARGDTYQLFSRIDWAGLEGGRTKL